VNEERAAASLRSLAALAEVCAGRAADIARLAGRYAATLRQGGTLYFAGNGGSAADALHVAAEYAVRHQARRGALSAVALTADTALLTAAGNDLGFDQVFARQVDALAGPDDLLILHSTSGQSANLLRAAEAARRKGTGTVALLGRDGGPLLALVDDALVVPSSETGHIQEIHLAIEHAICELVEEELFRS
jgi:D-sedoheptulose 7-phosphate isomerase